jgi:hypothetical protein
MDPYFSLTIAQQHIRLYLRNERYQNQLVLCNSVLLKQKHFSEEYFSQNFFTEFRMLTMSID